MTAMPDAEGSAALLIQENNVEMEVEETREGESRQRRAVASDVTPPLPTYHTLHPTDRPREIDRMLQFTPVDDKLIMTMKFIIPAEEAYLKVFRVELPEISLQCLGKSVNKCTNELLYSAWQIIGWECQQQMHQIDESGFHYQYCYVGGCEPPVGWGAPTDEKELVFQTKNLRYAIAKEPMNVRTGEQVWKFIPSKHTDINASWTDQYVSEKGTPPIIENDESGIIRNSDIKCIWGKWCFIAVGYTNKGSKSFDKESAHNYMAPYMVTLVLKPAVVKVNNWVQFIRDKAYDRLYSHYPILDREYLLGIIDNITPGRYTFGYDKNMSFKCCCACSLNEKSCKHYISHPMSSSL